MKTISLLSALLLSFTFGYSQESFITECISKKITKSFRFNDYRGRVQKKLDFTNNLNDDLAGIGSEDADSIIVKESYQYQVDIDGINRTMVVSYINRKENKLYPIDHFIIGTKISDSGQDTDIYYVVTDVRYDDCACVEAAFVSLHKVSVIKDSKVVTTSTQYAIRKVDKKYDSYAIYNNTPFTIKLRKSKAN